MQAHLFAKRWSVYQYGHDPKLMNLPNHFTTKFSNYQAKGIFNSGKVTLKHKTVRPYDLKINSNHLVSRGNHYTKQKIPKIVTGQHLVLHATYR